MKELIGRRILGVFVAPDESRMCFTTDRGVLAYDTYGDCCSTTWFADLTGFDALLGAEVISTEEPEMPEVIDGRARGEVDRFYGVTLVTERGHATIAYRNSSNGYYGGSLCDALDLAELPRGYREIRDDWSA